MKRYTKKRWCGIIALLLVLLCCSVHAADYEYSLNLSALPFSDSITVPFTGVDNTSYTVGYGNFLAGAASFVLNGTTYNLDVTVSVPDTTPANNYTSIVSISSNGTTDNTTFDFAIIDDTEPDPPVTADNFSIQITESTIWDNYYEMRYFGPDGTLVYVNTSSTAQPCSTHPTDFCNAQISIGSEGSAAFLYLPETNGAHQTDAVFEYAGYSFGKSDSFTVNSFSDLVFNFTYSPSEVNEFESVSFITVLSLYEDTLSYAWDFENDGTIDATTANVTKIFDTSGTYTVNLTVTDAIQSKSELKTITVLGKEHVVTVTVKAGTSFVDSAQVALDDSVKYTNATGVVQFAATEGNNTLRVAKEGYDVYNITLVVNNDIGYTVDLLSGANTTTTTSSEQGTTDTTTQNTQPATPTLVSSDIVLLSPVIGAQPARELVLFSYRVTNPSVQQCQLYTKQNDQQYLLKGSHNKITVDNDHEFSLTEMHPANYTWKIKCTDPGTEVFSEEWSFSIEDENQYRISEQLSATDEVIEKISEAIVAFRKLTDDQNQFVLDLFNVEEELYKHKDSLTGLKNTISQFDTSVDEQYFEKEINYAQQKRDTLSDKVLQNISIIDSTEFIYLPSDSDVEELSEEYLAWINAGEDTDRKTYFKKNKEFQKNVNIDAEAYLVELNYLSGRKEVYTLVQKTIGVSGDYRNHTFLEMIPKELAASYDELLVFGDNFNVVNYDPVLEFDISDSNIIRYAIKKRLFPSMIEKTKSALVYTAVDTRLLVFGLTLPLLFLLVVIPVLVGVFAAGLVWMRKAGTSQVVVARIYRYRDLLLAKVRPLMMRVYAKKPKAFKLSKKELSEVYSYFDTIIQLAKKGEEQRALELYNHIEQIYSMVGPKQQKDIDAKMHHVRQELTLIHITNLIQTALNHIKQEIVHDAKRVYDEILQHYQALPSHHQVPLKNTLADLRDQLALAYLKSRNATTNTPNMASGGVSGGL